MGSMLGRVTPSVVVFATVLRCSGAGSAPVAANARQAERQAAERAQSADALSGASNDAPEDLQEAARLQREADRHLDAKQLPEALAKSEQALAILQRRLGNVHPEVAHSLSTLGTIAFYRGEYERAEALLGDALRIRETVLGPQHPEVAESLNDLASVIQTRGDYVRPERLYLQALDIYTRAPASAKGSTRDLPALITELRVNLGRLYYLRGDHDRAETEYKEALAIRRRTLGPDHLAVADVLAGLGAVYYSAGRYAQAASVLQSALAIQQKQLPADHPTIATSSFNLAAVHFAQGRYQSARPLFERALSVDEKAVGPQHPRLAARLVGLAEVLRLQGEYDHADALYERALSIRERSLGSAHPDVAATLIARSLLRYAMGDFAGAADLLSKGAALREESLALVLTAGSEDQKRLFLRTLVDETDIALTLHLGAPASGVAARLALSSVVQRKGRSLDAMSDQIGALRRHLEGADRDVLDELSHTRAQLAAAVLKGITTDQQRRSATEARDRIQTLEQAIGARSAAFTTTSSAVSLDAVRHALPPSTALIELVSYRPFFVRNPHETAFGPPHYAAYVLRGDGSINGTDLGEAAVVDQQVRRFRAALSNPTDQSVRNAGRTLDQTVMAPLTPWLGGIERLIISPDGSLNLVPFAALVGSDGEYLVERYGISYVTSGRDLLRLANLDSRPSRQTSPPTIVANPQFNDPRQTMIRPAAGSAGTRAIDASVLERARRFSALPATGQEAEALAKVLPEARIVTGADATEAMLKGLSGPPILHVATHGFFLQPQPIRRPAGGGGRAIATATPGPTLDREDALVLSGLALAGANQRASGRDEDGILTALEVAGLDLWGTRLVVLSACETGVGDVRNGEGVYGMRRALVLAGSESQVMSLWQVADVATRDLMIGYYERLRAHEGRSDALRHVQLAMLHGDRRYEHPFFWAGFIQSGDWRPAFD